MIMYKFNAVLNLKEWIEQNREMLVPPVGNKLVYEDPDIIVMMVGGPNARKDYHLHDRGPEFFYQIEGEMNLKIMEKEGVKSVRIKEGEIFLMPRGTIHLPQRPPNTVGLVIEFKQKGEEIDRLRWYCEECNELLYEISFKLEDIVTELPVLMSDFFSQEDLRTCKKCGKVMEKPVLMKELD